MPVYNERATIERAIADALGADLPVAARQLVIIDDGSTDGTREWLGTASLPDNVEVVLHPKNKGKGAALRTGLGYARGTFSAVLDADLEYAAADLGQVLEPLLAGQTRVVFGYAGLDVAVVVQLLVRDGQQVVTMSRSRWRRT